MGVPHCTHEGYSFAPRSHLQRQLTSSSRGAQTPSSVCFEKREVVLINNMLLDTRFARVKNKDSLEVLYKGQNEAGGQEPKPP